MTPKKRMARAVQNAIEADERDRQADDIVASVSRPAGDISRRLADQVVEELFLHGAQRLVLEDKDGQYLGGWGRGPAADTIARVLLAGFARELQR